MLFDKSFLFVVRKAIPVAGWRDGRKDVSQCGIKPDKYRLVCLLPGAGGVSVLRLPAAEFNIISFIFVYRKFGVRHHRRSVLL